MAALAGAVVPARIKESNAMNFNPYLKPWQAAQPNNVAGKGQIEVPGRVPNIVWQNRAAAPTDYENALGDALEKVLDRKSVV